jgi:hypothetical protein
MRSTKRNRGTGYRPFLLYGEKPRNVSIELAGPSGWAVKTEKAYENETEKVAQKYKR